MLLIVLQDQAGGNATADRLLARMPDYGCGGCAEWKPAPAEPPKEALAECEHWLGRGSDLTVVQRMRALAFQVVLLTVLERFEEALVAAEEGIDADPRRAGVSAQPC